jgi:hypothetical protein
MERARIGVDELGEPTYANETITPELAKEYRDRIIRNRPIRWKKVEEYADSMQENDWRLNGQGISFGWDDIPLDGEHRYLACIRTGIPFRTLVSRGVDPETYRTMDDGSKRMFKDDLFRAGVANTSQTSGLMRKIAQWNSLAAKDEKGRGGLAGHRKFSVSRTALADMWPYYAKDIIGTIAACRKYEKNWPGDRGAMLFVWWLLSSYENDPEIMDKFFSVLSFGTEDQAGNSVLVKLREVLDGKVSRYRIDRKETGMEFQVYWMLHNWNRWISGAKYPSFNLGQGGLTNPFPEPERAR